MTMLCLCSLPPSTFKCSLNFYETWHVYHDTLAHLNGVLHKCLSISLCPSYCKNISTAPIEEELLGTSFYCHLYRTERD
jgi:hypothetical protein